MYMYIQCTYSLTYVYVYLLIQMMPTVYWGGEFMYSPSHNTTLRVSMLMEMRVLSNSSEPCEHYQVCPKQSVTYVRRGGSSPTEVGGHKSDHEMLATSPVHASETQMLLQVSQTCAYNFFSFVITIIHMKNNALTLFQDIRELHPPRIQSYT